MVKCSVYVGQDSTMVIIFASGPLDSQHFQKKLEDKIVNLLEVNQQSLEVDSGLEMLITFI